MADLPYTDDQTTSNNTVAAAPTTVRAPLGRTKVEISSGTRNLKFMRRARNATVAPTLVSSKKGVKCILINRYPFEMHKFTRKSFGGFNPKFDAEHKQHALEQREAAAERQKNLPADAHAARANRELAMFHRGAVNQRKASARGRGGGRMLGGRTEKRGPDDSPRGHKKQKRGDGE
eukprot:TRINITY_DN67737_c4_g2_i1.p1 TRINITY_DN67737_c4_g2~~TRINITY_DN67737_c4_g2_i1.p1  ORF type:complete len:176 (-),score=29.16 TRINITY_DN67737_c4_g2_i1:125-652(-)